MEERHCDLLCQEIPEVPPQHGGDLLGHTQREGPQQVLVRARSRPASAPVSPQSTIQAPEVTSRPTSVQSLVQSTAQVTVKEGWFCTRPTCSSLK